MSADKGSKEWGVSQRNTYSRIAKKQTLMNFNRITSSTIVALWTTNSLVNMSCHYREKGKRTKLTTTKYPSS
ncbi:11944_t:CDS:2 [Funneliformis geosporum]|uniref:11944_t:CDS:1 n=1 Tax=Funneliformis geosporum TaxID=1117311 RepID=A0A9W4SX43_9GLOM|nr:11944_t:CDS:2 [Funneliformis geosporum]